MTVELKNRYEFVYLFDVANGNPNGDPDAGNLPRMDPETSHGLVTDVALKRKIRDYVDARGEDKRRIFIRQKQPLNPKIAEACEPNGLPSFAKKGGGWDTNAAKNRSQADIGKLQEWLCGEYFDIRTFGAVMSTGPNAGQIRGPLQLTFARSVEPISPMEISITRVTDVDKEEGEMGRKHIVPYGLYRAHGFINAKLAEKTGFSEDDLGLVWDALRDMFEHDRSAARGEMTGRKLIAFKHETALGNARAQDLFARVSVHRRLNGDAHPVGDPRTHNWPPARAYADYDVRIDRSNVPAGVEVLEVF